MGKHEVGRRHFLQRSAAAGAALIAASAGAELPPHRRPGRSFKETGGYGAPSHFVSDTRLKGEGGTGLVGGSFSPLDKSHGIITPAGLHYEVHHNGCPDIDPARHELLAHGLVRSPKIFGMADLMRFPSVSRFHFLECAGNGYSEFHEAQGKTVQATHGLTSCSEWTGVALSTVLNELGVRESAKWVLAEGGDGAGLMRSIPIEKAMDDAILAYAQNGEQVRPEQGFPLRLFVPGYEGNMNVKWLKRLELGDQPWWTNSEVTEYADPMFGGTTQVFSFEMLAKSVITQPSAGMQLADRGYHEISGLAWSGRGKVARVDVSTDGGSNWHEARLSGPVFSKCHTRFHLPWSWSGEESVLQSRVTDESGFVQPTLAELRKGQPEGVNHNNAIQSWHVALDGTLTNVHHT